MSKVYVAIIGVGGVGRTFISQLSAYAQRNPSAGLTPIYVARSSGAQISQDYSGLDLSSFTPAALTAPPLAFPDEALNFLLKAPGTVILVDNTSSEALAAAYPAVLALGISIVTPNKKAFSADLALWRAIYAAAAKDAPGSATSRGYVYHEATVGAGLPVLSTLRELVATGDRVRRIEGVFSGTMSFLFNGYAPAGGDNGGKGFAACVAEARDRGYTEPDPRDDLNGLDVARKLTILARLVGVDVASPTSFPIESLIPAELESAASSDEFLAGLPRFDDAMKARKEAADREGKVLRYVGSLDVDAKDVKVGLGTFEATSAIGGLKGSDNIINFYTERYGENPLIVQGAGAGAAVTAMGVLGDLIKVLQRLK